MTNVKIPVKDILVLRRMSPTVIGAATAGSSDMTGLAALFVGLGSLGLALYAPEGSGGGWPSSHKKSTTSDRSVTGDRAAKIRSMKKSAEKIISDSRYKAFGTSGGWFGLVDFWDANTSGSQGDDYVIANALDDLRDLDGLDVNESITLGLGEPIERLA